MPLPHASCELGVAQYEPAAHVVCEVDPAGQYLPLSHAVCELGVAQYEPAAHVVCVVDPAGQ